MYAEKNASSNKEANSLANQDSSGSETIDHNPFRLQSDIHQATRNQKMAMLQKKVDTVLPKSINTLQMKNFPNPGIIQRTIADFEEFDNPKNIPDDWVLICQKEEYYGKGVDEDLVRQSIAKEFETKKDVAFLILPRRIRINIKTRLGKMLVSDDQDDLDLDKGSSSDSLKGKKPVIKGDLNLLQILSSKSGVEDLAYYAKILSKQPIVFKPGRIHFAILVNQRGDFHKFKWSIASNAQFFALIPVHETYGEAELKEQITKARTLETICPGQWAFINSSKIVSSRAKIDAGDDQIIPSGFDQLKDVGDLSKLDDQKSTDTALVKWAEQVAGQKKIYDVNSLVPFYNSSFVRRSRSDYLEEQKSDPVDALILEIGRYIAGKNVLFLWGSRTGVAKQYLKNEKMPARELRHKTGKALFAIIARLSKSKVIVLAGDPLSDIPHHIDLTSPWDSGIMKNRFKIDHGFSRLEQELLFFNMAKLASSTDHFGMQSGNIETLIDNECSNVYCINENTRGGAGLTNVDKISYNRNSNMDTDAKLHQHMYLSFSLTHLPSFTGELTRIMMERYGESVEFHKGLIKLTEETFGKKVKSESTIEDLAVMISHMTSKEVEITGLLHDEWDKLDMKTILRHFAHKVNQHYWPDQIKKKALVVKKDELNKSAKLLIKIAQATDPIVQRIIRDLNQTRVQPKRPLKDIYFDILSGHIAKQKGKLFDLKYVKSGDSGSMPKDPRSQAELYLAFMKMTIQGFSTDKKDSSDLEASYKLLVDDFETIDALDHSSSGSQKLTIEVSNRRDTEIKELSMTEQELLSKAFHSLYYKYDLKGGGMSKDNKTVLSEVLSILEVAAELDSFEDGLKKEKKDEEVVSSDSDGDYLQDLFSSSNDDSGDGKF